MRELPSNLKVAAGDSGYLNTQMVALQKNSCATIWGLAFRDQSPCFCLLLLHTWTGASSDQKGLSSSGKLLHCTLEFNEPLRGSHCGLPTFSFLSERCCVRAHLFLYTNKATISTRSFPLAGSCGLALTAILAQRR